MLWTSLSRVDAAASGSVAADEQLEAAMSEMNAALKSLGRGGITADNRDAALEALSKFQREAVVAKALTPPMTAKIDEKQRPEFVVGYRKMLAEAIKLACDAEIAVLDGKFEDADEILKNKLMGLKKAGHDKYQEEEEEGHERGGKHK
ncbi:MAG: hypothetical protein HZA52_08080 [Planctomycetes bacterium]|nr:hypothetical protein [Planctomycetota bacterium]